MRQSTPATLSDRHARPWARDGDEGAGGAGIEVGGDAGAGTGDGVELQMELVIDAGGWTLAA